MDAIKKALLMRLIPQRTMIGLGLLLLGVSGAAGAVLGSEVCGTGSVDVLCGAARKAIDVLGPWLTIIGVADRDRK